MKFVSLTCCSWVERGLVRVKQSVKEHYTMAWAGIQPRPLNTLTFRQAYVSLLVINIINYTWFSPFL